MKPPKLKLTLNIFLSVVLLLSVSLSVISVIQAAAPNPGHTWAEIGDVLVNLGTQVTGNLPVTNLAGGTGAATNSFWEGDGTWSTVSGSLINLTTITSGTTYTPSAGTNKIRIELWGGGGAGGSCTNVAGCAAGGGGSGSYLRYEFAGVGAGPYTIAIGAGGTAVAGGTGNSGGSTTFNTGSITLTAPGGAGGATAAGTAVIKCVAGGAGGAVAINGDANGAGMPGGPGITSTVVTTGASGFGGSTSLGGGGAAVTGNISATSVAGVAAVANTGSGGSGARAGAATAVSGGAGAAGRIIIWEFR